MYAILESGIERLRHLSRVAIDILQRFAAETVGLAVRPLQGQIGDMVEGTGPTVQGLRGVKHKGMLQLKADRAAHDAKMQTIRRNIQRLSDLARVCDYMMCASLLAVARASMADIVSLVSNPPKKYGFFSVLLCLGPHPRTIDLAPSVDDIQSGLQDLDNAMCALLNGVPRMLHAQEYAHVVEQGVTGLVLTQVLETDSQLLASRRACSAVFRADFARGGEFAKDFVELWTIRLHTSAFDLVRGLETECANENRTVELLGSARLIKRELQTLKKFGGDLERKKMANSYGTLQLDGRALRANLAGAIEGCMEVIRRELHETARSSCGHCLVEFSAHLKMLQRRPNSLKEFAAFIDAKAVITAQVRSLYQLATAVDEMYRSLNSIEVRVAAAEHVKLDDLHAIHGKFVETLSNADSDCASRMPIMSQALDKSVAALNDELLNTLTALHSGMYDNPESSSKVVLRELAICSENIDAVEEKIKVFVHYQSVFKISPYDFGYLKTVRDYCLDRVDVWSKLDAFRGGIAKIYDTAFEPSVSMGFRMLIDQCSAAAAAAVKKSDADKIAGRLMAEVKAHALNMDVIEALGNKTLQPRHWKAIYSLIGMSVTGDRLPKFREMQKYKLEAAAAAIADVSASATGEHALQMQLAEVEAKLPLWTLEFAADGTVANFEMLIGDMDAAAFALKGMALSRFSDIVGERLRAAAGNVDLYLRVVRSMDTLQRMWLVLRGVMESPEADVIMPVERASFVRVDGVWKELLLRTSRRNSQVHALVTAKDAVGFEAKLVEYTMTLETCRLKLDQFVDLKCSSFPRLLLLDRADIVHLLACGPFSLDNARVYQAAARACFPGVEELQFYCRSLEDGGGFFVKGIKPIEARSFALDSRVLVVGAVDVWFRDTLLSTRESLQSATHSAVTEHCHSSDDAWLLRQPVQCVALALKVLMQQSITAILLQRQDGSAADGRTLSDLAAECEAKSSQRSKQLIDGSLDAADRRSIIACVLLEVHFRDTLLSLHGSDCGAVEDFSWASTMRMAWQQADADSHATYVMKLFDYVVPCGFDVSPGDAVHVTTPQTTRFNLGVVSALRSLCCCHALYGPSGGGKTSLMQNLAVCLGKAFVAADVHSHVTSESLPLLMTAAASSSVWIALEHVNTWSTELVSRFSQALLSILADIRTVGAAANASNASPKSMRPDVARGGVLIFVTDMEASARSASPVVSSVVRQNFRPSHVGIPDEFALAEALFLVQGFGSARAIAKKIQHLFVEWRALLPLPCPQLNIKCLADIATCARRIAGSGQVGQAREFECVCIAVRSVALSRCPPELACLVQPQVELLFPVAAASVPEQQRWPLHADALKPAFSMAQMTWCDGMGAAAAQLCSALQTSAGVVVMGSCCSGKSSLITIASAFMSAQGPLVEMNSIDPNCCANQLFSFRAPNGMVTDGLLHFALTRSAPPPAAAAAAAAGKEPNCTWLHCDGDITCASDALLSHGRVSQVLRGDASSCFDRIVFETDSLQCAPPSLVGQLRIVYCPAHILSHSVFLHDLVKGLKLADSEAHQQVSDLVLELLPLTLDSLFPEGCGCVDAEWLRQRQLMTSVAQLIAAMFTAQACDIRPAARAKLFTFCLFWGLAGGIDRCIWDEAAGCCLEGDAALRLLATRVRKVCYTAALLPPAGESEDLHEYFVSEAGDWCRWDGLLADPLPLRGGTAVYVETARTAPCLHILTSVIARGQHAVLVGSRGSGKSVVVSALAAKLLAPSSSLTSSSAAFSFATFRALSRDHAAPAPALESFLRNLLDVSEAGTLVPAPAANLVVVIDDISACSPTARPSLNAALRQFCGSAPPGSRSALGCMHDAQTCGVLRRVTCTSVLVTASTRDLLSQRAARYLVPVCLRAPSEAHLTSVFEAVAAAAVVGCAPEIRSHMTKLAAVTVGVYHQLLRVAAPVAATLFPLPHPSDCLKVIDGCAGAGSVNTGSVKMLQRVWLHEMCRVFRDRFGSVGCGDFDKVFKGTCSSMLAAQVTDANISQLWTRFHSVDDGLYAPVSNIDHITDLLHARMSEFHKKHKERLSLVLERTSLAAIAFIARALQQPCGHCALLDHTYVSSRSLCLFSGHVAGFSVIEMPAIDCAAAGAAFLRAAASQCIEGDTRLALVIREEALVFDQVLALVAALAQGDASAVFERNALLHLARKVSKSLPISGGSTLQLIDNFATEALQHNFKIILIGCSSPSSPIAALPHLASMFTFHAAVQPQSAFFSAALQASVGSGFAEFQVGGTQGQVIADALTAVRDAVMVEAERAHMSVAMKQKLAGSESCAHAVQAFHAEVTLRTQKLADDIALTQSSVATCAALAHDCDSMTIRIAQLRQQLDHAHIGHQDVVMSCNGLKAAVAFTSRPPPAASTAHAQLLGFADHLLVDILTSSYDVAFADSVGEALYIMLDAAMEDSNGIPLDHFKGTEALSVIKDCLKKKGCVAKEDSLSSSWILEGISRHAAVKPDFIMRLHQVLTRSNVQHVYNSGRDSIDELDVCLVEFFVSLHNAVREQELQNTQSFLETAIRKEIEIQSTLDDTTAAHASLTTTCGAMKSLEEKWKSDVESLQLQQSRLVGDALQMAVQVVWGVLFAPGHREILVTRASESLSFHGIDAANSILELNIGFMPVQLNVYETLAISALTHERLGLAWTMCRDPDQRLQPALERHVQSKSTSVRISSTRTDDPSFAAALERSVNDGHLIIVHVVDPAVPHILLDLVRTRTLQVFGRPYVRIGSRMLEAHRNFTLVVQLSLLTFEDVPGLFGACRAVDLTLHSDCLVRHVAAALVFGRHAMNEPSPISTAPAAAAHEAVLQCETRIMQIINNPSLRIASTALPLIESASTLLSEHLALQAHLKEQQDGLAQLPTALKPQFDFATAAACMLGHVRAMHSIAPDAGCTLPKLIDMCVHIINPQFAVSESSPTLFHALSRHMAPAPRLIFALLFACARDPSFMAPELIFLQSPIGLDVSAPVDGYELPGCRDLEWLPLDVWARVAAFTALPGVGVDVLKSMRARADAWKKWYQSIDKGGLEQFPEGFSKKLTPLQGVCLARCFSEHLLQPMLRLYLQRTLGAAYDESRFDSQWIAKASVPVPVVIKEHEGSHAMSVVVEMRGAVHGDDSVSCVVADGSNWSALVSNVSLHLSAGRWVMMHCMAALPWDTFVQLYEISEKYHNMSSARLFVVHSASGSLPRDACAMCLHLGVSLPSSPSSLFETVYTHLLPLCLPRTRPSMSVSEAFKHLAATRRAVFELTSAMVLAEQHSALADEANPGDLRNTTFIKALGARCASAANALFRHSREFPVANIPRGYTYATVSDIVKEGLKELNDWAPTTVAHRFTFALNSTLGNSAPTAALQEQGTDEVLQHMTGFRWPSTLQQLKVDLVRLAATQARDSVQLRAGLQSVPCLYPCRSLQLVPFDVTQLSMLLGLFPPRREWSQQQDSVSTAERGPHDGFAVSVHMVASVELSHVCGSMQQLWALINAAHDYSRGLVSAFDLLSCVYESPATRTNIPAFSVFTSVGIATLRAAITKRVVLQYSALKSAANRTESGLLLGAFSVPFRLLSAARSHSARVQKVPVESLRIRASVVATLGAAKPVFAVCDVACPNAIWTTNKGNDCDAVIFGSQSLQPLPLAFFIETDANAGKSTGSGAVVGGGVRVASVPIVLQSAAAAEDAADRVVSIVDARLDGVNPEQLAADNVYLAVWGY